MYIHTFSLSTFAIGKLPKNGIAEQSSTYSDWNGRRSTASFGYDGVYPQHETVYCTATESSLPIWWKVTLGFTAKIMSIEIYNRRGCCEDRLGNSVIEIINTSGEVQFCAKVGDTNGVFVVNVECDKVLKGNTVIITNTKVINIWEVDIYGIII